uniref:T-cell immunomodulatory protein n=1 Tax=Lygus hesperus TaxID=30085 RepID=A0A146LKX2_LYGHE
MKLQEVQTCKCTPQVQIPFSTCWSDDNLLAMATEKGIYTVEGRWRARNIFVRNPLAMTLILLVCVLHWGHATDITSTVFGKPLEGIPAAFGDFNSDEYPDLFVIKDNTFEILLGRDSEPLIQKSPGDKLKCKFDAMVTSIVPGDYDGDAIMDVLVTLSRPVSGLSCEEKHVQEIKVLWGSGDSIECGAKWDKPLYMCGQPLAMDWNEDMIIDLFGSVNNTRAFWVFNTNRTFPAIKHMTSGNREPDDGKQLRIPHSHAFIDLNSDYNPDMFVTTNEGFEVWLKDPNDVEGFAFSRQTTLFPNGLAFKGQSIFLDTELKGKLDHILPACYDIACTNSSMFVYVNNRWLNLRVNFHDKSNDVWGFVPPTTASIIHSTITLHAGDYNMDGFPDILATLQSGNRKKTFLLMNEQCVADCSQYSRTFTIAWDKLSPNNNNTNMGVFYDFMQDGKLDIIFVNDKNITAFKNNLDYDANFIKVMVITGRKDQAQRIIPDPTGRRNRTYGTNLPGPLTSYNATDLDDEPRASVSAQLSQSAYLSLHLPYTLFGLGRTPNFVDELRVGVYGKSKKWSQIIPNSQMVVIPIPLQDPTHWMVRLFVTPSKLIIQSFVALLGTCMLLTLIIAVLWWKERREDRRESRQEVHRFNYSGLG